MKSIWVILIAMLMAGCAGNPRGKTLEFPLPLDAFGDKVIQSSYEVESLAGDQFRIVFEGSESFSFHSGFQIRTSYQGSADGNQDASGQWVGQGHVELTIWVTDPIQHETFIEKRHGITVTGNPVTGPLKGVLGSIEKQ